MLLCSKYSIENYKQISIFIIYIEEYTHKDKLNAKRVLHNLNSL